MEDKIIDGKRHIWYNGRWCEVEDATPSWSAVLPMLLETLREQPKDSKAYIAASVEVFRMAGLADKYVSL